MPASRETVTRTPHPSPRTPAGRTPEGGAPRRPQPTNKKPEPPCRHIVRANQARTNPSRPAPFQKQAFTNYPKVFPPTIRQTHTPPPNCDTSHTPNVTQITPSTRFAWGLIESLRVGGGGGRGWPPPPPGASPLSCARLSCCFAPARAHCFSARCGGSLVGPSGLGWAGLSSGWAELDGWVVPWHAVVVPIGSNRPIRCPNRGWPARSGVPASARKLGDPYGVWQ